MPASFGLVPELTQRIKDKRLRYSAYKKRSTDVLNIFKKKLDYILEKDQIDMKIIIVDTMVNYLVIQM